MAQESLRQPETIVNELNQRVRVYEWEDFQRRLRQRKLWKGDVDLNGKHLVIKHTWGLGDVLYSTAALRLLKEKFPKVKITYISGFTDILENNPDVDKNINAADSPSTVELTESMTSDWYWLDYDTPLKGGYDYKIHLRTKPALNEFLVSLLKRDPNTLENDERDFVNQASSSVIARYKMIALDMYCAHAYVGEGVTDKSVYYYPYDYELEMARRFLVPIREKGYKIVTLMPHSSTPFKDYPHWKEVIKLCSPKYFWLILDNFNRANESWIGTNMYNTTGAFKLRQAAAIIIEGDLNCSSDTGLLYTKASRGGKCVVTYGPHEPEPFLHYFPSAHGLRVEHLTKTEGMNGMCSTGCYIDTNSCRKGGGFAPCLEELSPKRVADKITDLLESKS